MAMQFGSRDFEGFPTIFKVEGGSSTLPWKFQFREKDGDNYMDVVGQAILASSILNGDTIEITNLTDLSVSSSSTYWLKAEFGPTGAPTKWSISDEGPNGGYIEWGGSPNFYQTGAWYPLARVIPDYTDSSNLPGFSFSIGENEYFLEQLCTSRLLLVRGVVNGRLIWYPTPL